MHVLSPNATSIFRFYENFYVRDNVHSHLRHAKRPMAVRGGGGGVGGLSNGRFPWTKWDFCSEVEKKMYKTVEIKCKR